MMHAGSGEDSFRRRLANELPDWVAEEILDPAQAEALRARYRLGELASESSSRLLLAVYLIGALLIGGGVISFAAANWQVLPVALRVGLLLAALFACHCLGWYWWQFKKTRPLLGHALVTLGTFVFSANIVLISQMLQIQGDWQNVFGSRRWAHWPWRRPQAAAPILSLPWPRLLYGTWDG